MPILSTDIPPPGQVSIAAVKPEAVFLKWVNPEGLSGPLKFRVSWRCRLNTHHRFIDVKNSEVQIQGLIPGEEYAFTVATLSSDGGHSLGVSITASTEVPPPTNLTVETKVTSVSVNWKKPAGVAEVSYLLTLSRDEEHQTLHTDSEEHIFNHLKLEMEYTISVLTALSTGAQSKPVFKVISTCIPIPENLEVGSVTAASASLSWSMPSEMDEIPHSFLVSYHSKGTEPQTISTDTCSAVITGLTPDSEHSVSICTKLQDGRQGQPAVTSFQTGIPLPGIIEFTSVQPHAVALRWEPPKGLAGLYRYKVSWRGGGMLRSLEVSTRNVEARGLAPGEKYEFTVATLCDDDRQSPHAVATVRTEIPVPEHVRVESNTTSLSVKWEKPGGLKEVSYQLTLSRNEECQAISTDSLEHCFSALSPGTKYSVSVSTVLNDCQSKPVWNTTCTTIPVPEELVVDSVTLTSATISWSVPSVMDQTPHSFLISYHSEGAKPTDITTDAYNTIITGLKPGIEYMVCVCVVCENTGKGQPASASINIGIPIPDNLEVGSVTAASASLSWSMPSEMDDIPHSFLVSYHSKGTEPQTISTDTCSAVITGLTPDSEHSVSICTKLQDGRQGQPAVTSFQTEIFFLACMVCVCVVSKNTGNGQPALTSINIGTSAGLLYSEKLIYRVDQRKQDHFLNDNISSIIEATTIKNRIPIPENLEVGSVTAASASLSWSMPSEMDEIPHSFLVSYHSKGTEPQTISTDTCSAALTALTPDSEHSVSIFTKLQDGRQGQPAVTSFQTG
ncbi:hypothetical protein ACEWY4_024991 [Coilia grayii]|uniref:Fibronectin type-III domain-containing protein n=1 Tax=Coilia grayii TaxID=363190 RepID=A0ABD1IWA7_9TELE